MKLRNFAIGAFLLGALSLSTHCQVINGPIAITGNSLVNFAPWQDSGIVPKPDVKGWDSLTCPMLYQGLPWDVPLGIKISSQVLATNDINWGYTTQQHAACVNAHITWLLANRPGIKIVLANTPPMTHWNPCTNSYRDDSILTAIADYNAFYATVARSYPPGRVVVADIWTGASQSDGWGNPDLLSGPCGEHFGQPQQLTDGEQFFMGTIAQAIRGMR